MARLSTPTLAIERSLWRKGFRLVAGVDEVGRGAFAGPVVAAAVILPQDFTIPPNFADSKQLKPQQRKALAQVIKGKAIAYSVAEIGVMAINKFGIGKATQMAFRKAIKNLKPAPNFILIDAFYVKHLKRQNQLAIVKGDERSASIAAASILAKVHRDALMKKLALKYPLYGFAKNKGYGTNAHRAVLVKYGLSRVHRRSFRLIENA